MATRHTAQGIGRYGPMQSASEAWTNRDQQHQKLEEQMARGLGWFSVGLGLAEFIAPKSVAKFIGVKNHKSLLRFLGLREIASGLGIFLSRRPGSAVWSRVGGDFMDLALLGGAMTSDKNKRKRIAAAATAVAGVTAVDFYCATQLSNTITGKKEGRILIIKSANINRPVEEVYRFWRDFENLPRFMTNLQKVQITGENRSHWAAKGPGDTIVEWDAEVVTDTPNELITWHSVGGDIENAGAVQFVSMRADRGTRIIVEMQYKPPVGRMGATIAKFFAKAPEQQLQEDLRRLKQILETGEIATTKGQPSGRRKGMKLLNKLQRRYV